MVINDLLRLSQCGTADEHSDNGDWSCLLKLVDYARQRAQLGEQALESDWEDEGGDGDGDDEWGDDNDGGDDGSGLQRW